MRILHLINTLSAGGAELHLLALCEALQTLGIEPTVACLKEHVRGSRSLRADFEAAGVQVFNLQAERSYDPRPFLRLRHLLDEFKPSILHTHLPRADLVGFVVHLDMPSIPWVCSVHDIHSRAWRARRLLPLFRLIWQRADRLIAISEAVKEWLIREYRLPTEKIEVVHYGLDLDAFLHPRPDPHRSSKLGGGPVLGAIGRLEPRKGHDTLIRAMPLVLESQPETALLIAGHDPWGYGRELHALIAKLGLQANVRLLGFQQDIPSFLHALDVFAFGSRSEGFGQVLIEAMAAGKPVVASRIAPLTEIVVEGETGLLADPADPEEFARALIWLLSHPQQAREMGTRGRARVRETYSVRALADATLALYRNLAACRGSADRRF